MTDNDYRSFREDIITSLNFDILVLCETFLRDGNVVDIDNYTWIPHNRLDIDPRAVRGSGGVGILVHSRVTNAYNVHLVDKSHEGIIWIKFIHKSHDCLEFYVCGFFIV